MTKQTFSAIKIGKLPAAFICLAFVNFTVGALLGVFMVLQQSFWPQFGPLHAELNPFGWLSMLIYGMTYAVLAIIAGLTLPWPVLGWLQLLVAEAGVICILFATTSFSGSLLRFGLVLQALSPLLFMINILSTVFAKRRQLKRLNEQTNKKVATNEIKSANDLSVQNGQMLERFFGRPDFVKATDKVAQKGTELALFAFLAAAVWALLPALHNGATGFYATPYPSALLSYYGWIAGTVLMVSLHLYPRYAGFRVIQAWQAQAGQLFWVVAMILAAYGAATASTAVLHTGIQIFGLTFVWFAVFYLRVMASAFKNAPAPSAIAWWGSWIFALVLGISLILGLDPLSLPALHMLFLGWITSLVYGVGYTFFPLILGRQPLSLRASIYQVWIAISGAILMSISFYMLGKDPAIDSQIHFLLGLGGCLAAFAFFQFLSLWILGKKVSQI